MGKRSYMIFKLTNTYHTGCEIVSHKLDEQTGQLCTSLDEIMKCLLLINPHSIKVSKFVIVCVFGATLSIGYAGFFMAGSVRVHELGALVYATQRYATQQILMVVHQEERSNSRFHFWEKISHTYWLGFTLLRDILLFLRENINSDSFSDFYCSNEIITILLLIANVCV